MLFLVQNSHLGVAAAQKWLCRGELPRRGWLLGSIIIRHEIMMPFTPIFFAHPAGVEHGEPTVISYTTNYGAKARCHGLYLCTCAESRKQDLN